MITKLVYIYKASQSKVCIYFNDTYTISYDKIDCLLLLFIVFISIYP